MSNASLTRKDVNVKRKELKPLRVSEELITLECTEKGSQTCGTNATTQYIEKRNTK